MKVKIRAKVNLSRPVCCIRDAAFLSLPPSLFSIKEKGGGREKKKVFSVQKTEWSFSFL